MTRLILTAILILAAFNIDARGGGGGGGGHAASGGHASSGGHAEGAGGHAEAEGGEGRGGHPSEPVSFSGSRGGGGWCSGEPSSHPVSRPVVIAHPAPQECSLQDSREGKCKQ